MENENSSDESEGSAVDSKESAARSDEVDVDDVVESYWNEKTLGTENVDDDVDDEDNSDEVDDEVVHDDLVHDNEEDAGETELRRSEHSVDTSDT